MFARSKIVGVNGGNINFANQEQEAVVARANRGFGGKTQVTANMAGYGGGGGASMNVNTFMQSSYQYYMTGILPADPHLIDTSTLALFYRDVYLFDNTAGAAVDIQSAFPFSDWELRGLPEHELEPFNTALERLSLKTMMPFLSTAYLTDGFFCGSLIFDPRSKQFIDTLIHDALSVAAIPSPFYNIDPTINVRVGQAAQQFMHDTSEYARRYLDAMPRDFIEMLKSGAFTLDPVTTLFVPRRSTTDRAYTSYLHRILPMYMIEKTLYRGTLVEAQRRQRAMTHVTAGDDVWTPSPQELNALVSAFQEAEMDPSGGWLATRSSVASSDLRCLGGNNLINTDQGLIKIKDIVKHNPGTLKEGTKYSVDIKAKNHTGEYVPVKYWWYQGFKPTLNIELEDGTKISATKNHKFVTVDTDAKRILVKAESLNTDTWLLKPTLSTARNELLELNLEHPDVEARPSNYGFELPEYMTPELAYCMALIISEGSVFTGSVSVVNSDRGILEQYADFMERTFGLDSKRNLQKIDKKVITERNIKGENWTFTKGCGTVAFNSMHLVNTLEQLGVFRSKILRTATKSPSYKKSVPWSILQADHRSQLAFLSGYLDGDGSFKVGKRGHSEIVFRSTSRQICYSIHAILTDLGYRSLLRKDGTVNTVSLSVGQSAKLAEALIFNKKIQVGQVQVANVTRSSNKLGIPADLVTTVLLERDISIRNYKDPITGSRGSLFLDDEGKEVFVSGGWKSLFNHFIYAATKDKYSEARSFFSYENYDRGEYNAHLALIKKVSKSLYKNVIHLFKHRYQFCKVVSITEGKEQHVYDLTMDESNAPLFTVNGVLSKNSGGDFWKWTDMTDIMVPYKLRALGISEAFLSGDASFAAAESAYSTFLESMNAYRTGLTERVFYSKLFPLIAVVNNLYKEGSDKARAGKIVEFLFNKSNRNNLKMPQLHWHKELEAKGEENMAELLETASSKGIPIPLRMWAAAAHIDIDSLLRELKEDSTLREELAKYTHKDTSHEGEDADSVGHEFDDDDEGVNAREETNASLFPLLQQKGRIVPGLPTQSLINGHPSYKQPLLAREFGDSGDNFGLTKTGKIKYLPNSANLNRKMNDNILKIASKADKDPHYREQLRKKNLEKLGRTTLR